MANLFNDPAIDSVVRYSAGGKTLPPPPTWMDIFEKHKKSTNNFNGKGVNSWDQDATHQATKRRFDQEYIDSVAAYNRANGTNIKPDQSVLGVKVNPNEWHKPEDNVDQKGGFLGKDPLAAAAKLAAIAAGGYFAMPYLAGAAGAGAGGAASGLAGTLGMTTGTAASMVNAAGLNTAMSLARGQNIGDSLKSGATGAILAPVAGMASNAVGGGTIGSVVGNAASGGAGAVLRGRDPITGIRDGAVNGMVSAAGKWVGNQVAGETGMPELGKAAGTATSQVLRGKPVDVTGILVNAAGDIIAPEAKAVLKNMGLDDTKLPAGMTAQELYKLVAQTPGGKQLFAQNQTPVTTPTQNNPAPSGSSTDILAILTAMNAAKGKPEDEEKAPEYKTAEIQQRDLLAMLTGAEHNPYSNPYDMTRRA